MRLWSAPPLIAGLAVISLVVIGCTGETREATRVTSTAARLNAHGTSGSSGSTYYFEYGPFGGPMTPTQVSGTAPPNVTASVFEDVGSLQPGVTYVFRVCGKDTSETDYHCAGYKAFTTTPANLAGNAYTERPLRMGTSATSPADFEYMLNTPGPHMFPGDGVLSLRLPGGATLWMFGDGGIQGGDGQLVGSPPIRNMMVLQDGPLLSAVMTGTKEDPHSSFRVPGGDAAESLHWYWPGQPFMDGGKVRIPLGHVTKAGGLVDTVLATVDPGSLATERLTTVSTTDIAWGEATVQDGSYTYIYGGRSESAGPRTYLARALFGQAEGPWQYRTATGWSSQEADATPILQDGIDSVVRTPAGHYAAVFDIFARINLRTGDNPWSFGPVTEIYNATDTHYTMNYQARLHPEFNAGGKILLNYSLNGSQDKTNYPNGKRFVSLDASLLGP
jgi:hypothetical protein